MTLLQDAPSTWASSLPAATLLVVALPADPHLQDAAEHAVRRETRSEDHVSRPSAHELAVLLTVPAADLDAVADRLLQVVERATGRPSAAGVCAAGRTDALGLARAGLAVAWACGGSRAVRHP